MDREAWWAIALGVQRVRHDSDKTTTTPFNFFNITCVREIIWKQNKGHKHNTEIIRAKCSRNTCLKHIQSRWNWSYYCDWFRLITFGFFPIIHPPIFEKMEAFLTCRSVLWGFCKHPIREVHVPASIGSANEKHADSEAQSLTQSMNTCPGLKRKKSSRNVQPLRLRWERDVIPCH